MKSTSMKRVATLGAALSVAGLALIPASTLAAAKGAAGPAAADQTKLKLIINRGNSEITRRLAALQQLDAKIGSATKLTDSDKATLTGEVNDEINGLNSLKAKLDADTTVADARADAQSIVTGYRVYALIVPKINLVKTADDQQVAEARLSALITKFETRLNAAKSQGKNVTALQNALKDMQNRISAAQAISPDIQSNVIGLQPSDYNSDHSLLSGKRDQLKTAQADIKAAVNDATTIVDSLKNL